MLNAMFNEMEKTYVVEALKDYQGSEEVDLADQKAKDSKVTIVCFRIFVLIILRVYFWKI